MAFAIVTLEVLANSFNCIYYLSIYFVLRLPKLPNVSIDIVTYVTLDMSQSYSKSCMFCKQEIVMSDKGAGKWLPYDLNGTVHECKNKKPVQQSQIQIQTQEPQQKPITLEEVDIRLRRVEKILFTEGAK